MELKTLARQFLTFGLLFIASFPLTAQSSPGLQPIFPESEAAVHLDQAGIAGASSSVNSLLTANNPAFRSDVGFVEADPAEKTITGKVTDENGDPLIGATVVVKGSSSIGTVTDIDGNYELAVPDDAAVLVISYVGYLSQEVPINGRTTIDVALQQDIAKLEEVVVVGYGTAKSREITSSIVSVDAEDFNRGNVNDPTQLLQGKVAGLQIARAGSNPNQPFAIRLRGLSTLGQNSEPLVVIDGVIGGSLDILDPNDIESIEVLKDASAAAIYGTRGSSGVIIVTTKSGANVSDTRLDYNGYVAFESVQNTHPIASPEQFIEAGGQDLGSRTDWIDEITQTGISNVHNIAVTSNNRSSNYRASVNYRDVAGVLTGRGFEQFNARLNFTQKLLNDRLRLTSIASFTQRDSDFGFPQALRYSTNFPPTAPVFDPNSASGYFQTGTQDVFNPVELNEINTNIGRNKGVIGNFKAEYELLEGLSVMANYSIQTQSNLTGTYISNNSLWANGNAPANNGIATRTSSDDVNELFEFTSSYEGEKGDLTYTVLGGYSFQELTTEGFSVTNTDFITNEVTFNNLGLGNGFNNPAGTRSASSFKTSSRLIAFFGRASLNLDNAYYFTASYRREGSSRFGANNRWGNFWSVSGGVDLATVANLGFFDNLKLRAGYGVTGNPPADALAFLAVLRRQGSGFVNGEFVPAIGPGSNPNPDLKWEEKGELNLGLDFALLDYRLSGSVDYFIRNTSDLLNTISVPTPPNEFGTSLVNVGELETKGLEVQLNFKALERKDFSWDISANYSTFKTTLVQWNLDEDVVLNRGNIGPPGLNNTFISRLSEGDEIGQLLAPIFVRYNDDGVAVLLDKDGNETTERNTDDFVVVGNGLPDFNLGINNSLRFKNLDLNFFLRGSFGHSLANISRAYFEHPAVSGRQNIIITDFYNPQDAQTDAWHSAYVEDASFLKLDNATLGYTFNFAKNSAFRALRLYFSGQNIFVITDYTGADPEVRYFDPGPSTEGNSNNQFAGDILVPGIDRRVTYFPSRIWTLGLNVSF
ncbi:MAG: SusC/RagA family TonB-linked outer membrane protein [Phaeodactylibacter sp.]|nr:SusC/RagA family TonB-linked outer membrane protein [Phaeodactylibacter sp.]